jgi:glycosyltransferase involved in cell wall biosynthesis
MVKQHQLPGAKGNNVQKRIDEPELEISIVLPVYNEAGNLETFIPELSEVLQNMDRSYEIIAVDDGSKDASCDVLRRLKEVEPNLRIIRFRRNFGQTAGFAAGFDLARGKYVITMDADGQNDPADIPGMLQLMEEGEYDIVSGWRQERKEPFLSRRLPSMIANRIIGRSTGVVLHDYGCSLKIYHWQVAKNVKLYGELHRFIPALASGLGVKVAEVPVNDRPRQYGSSKYNLTKSIRVILDLVTVSFLLTYMARPMQLFGLAGLISGGLGFLLGLYLTLFKIITGADIGSRPLLSLAILLMILGVQFIVMGLLGELQIRTYFEVQDKPIYAIRAEE